MMGLTDGHFKQTGHKIVAITYYGARHTAANETLNTPVDMKNMKLRLPEVPMYMTYAKAVGATSNPILRIGRRHCGTKRRTPRQLAGGVALGQNVGD